ncbi:MAG TPA: hypothetical protein PLC99_22410 [Verrucomicrobiota bacterium]|nr:hypothetical protein [Verrucomicrobiota bacterium]
MMIHHVNVFFTQPKELMMKVSEISTAVTALSEQLVKVQVEILGKIEALETALTDVDLPEDAVDALNALRGNVQAIDDIVPDVVVEPTE